MKVTGNWEKYPELLTWIEEMKLWVSEYGIYQFVHADDAGFDPSGVISKTDPQLVWTNENESITSQFREGNFNSWGVSGWYLGTKPHSENIVLEDMKTIDCDSCEGEECESCEFEGVFWAYFEDTPLYPLKKSAPESEF